MTKERLWYKIDKKINSHGDLQNVDSKSRYAKDDLMQELADKPKYKIVNVGLDSSIKAYSFNRIKTKHHQSHIEEMGCKNEKEYINKAIDFFNNGDGDLFYSESRQRYYKYNRKNQYLVVVSNGVVHTFLKINYKKFLKIKEQDKLK